MAHNIGTVVGGSLAEGLSVRLHAHVDLEEIRTGKFVTVCGNRYRFFSMITDLQLGLAHPDIALFPPQEQDTLLMDVLKKREVYAMAIIRPLLTLDSDNQLSPVKTIPPHFARVTYPEGSDIIHIFGNEQDSHRRYFRIGSPLDMQEPVCIDLDKITERSNGIFGKTGTGKTFLTRLVLAGLIQRQAAVALIFDMHSEYGLQARKEGAGATFVKGLKTLFPDRVAIFSLDPESTRRRGSSPDVAMRISYRAIQVDDVLSLQHELNFHPTACEAAYLVYNRYKDQWLVELFARADTIKELAQEVGAHPESLAALYRKLRPLERFPFLENTMNQRGDVVEQMVEYLDRGISVIIEFGNYTSTLCYLLIANMVTRRIHSRYIQKTEQYLGSHRAADEPKKLLIVIEEAHKFLSPVAAQQTIFGIIAREMRKYYVSLLVVDQRPSGIDSEILSQIGTKIIAQLHDERDIQAVLNGIAQAQYLRTVLASLDSKKQVLMIGHAVAMSVVVETRTYDEKFYREVGTAVVTKPVDDLIKELF